MRLLSIPRVSSLVTLVALASTAACTDNLLSPGPEATSADPSLARGRRSVVSVDVTPDVDTLSAAQPSAQLHATTRDSRGKVTTRTTVTWSSLTPGVASVDAVGKVTAKGVGTALIVAAAAAVADTAVVVVHDIAASVTVRPDSVTVPAGDSTRLSAV